MVAAILRPVVQTPSPMASNSGAGREAEEEDLTLGMVEEVVVADGPLYRDPVVAEGQGCTAVADYP